MSRMSNETFESVRLLFILAVIGFRLAFFRRYLQAYLNIAPQKLTYIRRETGRISNVDLQKAVTNTATTTPVLTLNVSHYRLLEFRIWFAWQHFNW